MIAQITVRRNKTKQWFRKQILPKKRCRRCGESDPIVLDFHHIKPATKKAKVSRLVDCAFNKTIILLEIRKCVVLCANCHRKYHHKRKNDISGSLA